MKERMNADGKTASHSFEVDTGHGFMPFGTDACKR
jgi:hypothetical protein